MNKAMRVMLNIMIVIAAIVLFFCLVNLALSIQYANREVEDPVKTYQGIFEYELKNRAYGEIMGDYYVRRLSSFTPQPGYEDLYRVAEYAHNDFMIRVFEEKGDTDKASAYIEKKEKLKRQLGAYEYTADEVDEMIKNAP